MMAAFLQSNREIGNRGEIIWLQLKHAIIGDDRFFQHS